MNIEKQQNQTRDVLCSRNETFMQSYFTPLIYFVLAVIHAPCSYYESAVCSRDSTGEVYPVPDSDISSTLPIFLGYIMNSIQRKILQCCETDNVKELSQLVQRKPFLLKNYNSRGLTHIYSSPISLSIFLSVSVSFSLFVSLSLSLSVYVSLSLFYLFSLVRCLAISFS